MPLRGVFLTKKAGISNLMQHLEQKRKENLTNVPKKWNCLQTQTVLSSFFTLQMCRVSIVDFIWGQMSTAILSHAKSGVSKALEAQVSIFQHFQEPPIILTKITEQDIADELPDCIALVFDGHPALNAYYVGIFASLSSFTADSYEDQFLTINDET